MSSKEYDVGVHDIVADLINEEKVSDGLSKYVSKYLCETSMEVRCLNDFFQDMGYDNEFGSGGVLDFEEKGVKTSFGFNHFDPKNDLRIYRNYFSSQFDDTQDPDIVWFRFLFSALDEGLDDEYFNKVSENSQGSRKYRINLSGLEGADYCDN